MLTKNKNEILAKMMNFRLQNGTLKEDKVKAGFKDKIKKNDKTDK